MPKEKLPVAKLNARIINKHDTESNWDKATNFIPKKGEIIVYEADDNAVPYLKVGNGTKTVTELPYVSNKNTDEAIEQLKNNDVFKDEDLILKPLGGISVGDSLKDMSIKEVLKKLLYPYVAPEINSFILTPTPDIVYEKHVPFTVDKAVVKVTKKSENITEIRLGDGDISYDIDITERVLNGDNINVSTQYDDPDEPIICKLSVWDGVSTVEDTKTYTFVYPYFYGVISNGDTINSTTILNFEKSIRVQGSHSHEYTTTNQCPVIAYPKSYGELKSIKDPNNFTQGWTLSTVTVNNDTTIKNVEYYVYVGGASTATATYKFNY